MRREFLEQMLADPQWSERFEAAETTEQLIEVVEAYCKEKKLKLEPVKISSRHLSRSSKAYPQLFIGKFPFWLRLKVRILGRQKFRVDKLNFTKPTKIYVAWCGEHRIYYLDYLRTYNEATYCPECLLEEKALRRS